MKIKNVCISKDDVDVEIEEIYEIYDTNVLEMCKKIINVCPK